MTEVTAFPPGTFCWVDLATPDPLDARAFYAEVFGWEFADRPTGPGMVYTMCLRDGREVCALYALSEEKQSAHVPPHWFSYISVADADRSAVRAAELGGLIIAPAFDVLDAGRMAVIQDPTGAVAGLWQPRRHHGASLVNAPGSLCWNELQTRDCASAERFYTGLFGWTACHKNSTGVPYTEFRVGERPNGGMLEIQTDWGNVPPHWLCYFAVEDCDESAGLAAELGGNVCLDPTDIPDIGRFCLLQDRQGASFAIISLLNPD